jgi:hypothetical protein
MNLASAWVVAGSSGAPNWLQRDSPFDLVLGFVARSAVRAFDQDHSQVLSVRNARGAVFVDEGTTDEPLEGRTMR